jgi:hypothetical protein
MRNTDPSKCRPLRLRTETLRDMADISHLCHNWKSRQHISISSSVRPSSVRGTVTSNALATLISNSIFGSLVSVAKLFLDH